MLSSIKLVGKCVNCVTFRNYSIQREARFLGKILDKQKKIQMKGNKLNVEVFSKATKSGSRRLTALNKVYMEHITEVIQSGKYSSILLDFEIGISKVEFSSDLRVLHVYWISKKSVVNIEEIKDILDKSAPEIRREIANMRYIAKVPQIKFVRDISCERHFELDRLFNIIDLGRDHKPTDPSRRRQPEVVDDFERTLPIMTHNAFGLDHALIKKRILTSIAKSKAVKLPKKDFEIDGDEGYETPGKLVSFNKKIFEKFLQKRKSQELKMRKHFDSLEMHMQFEDDEDYDDDKDNSTDVLRDVDFR